MSDPLYQTSQASDNRCMNLCPSVQEGFTLHQFPQNPHHSNFCGLLLYRILSQLTKNVENSDQVLLTP